MLPYTCRFTIDRCKYGLACTLFHTDMPNRTRCILCVKRYCGDGYRVCAKCVGMRSMCKYFEGGKCLFGDLCIWVHGMNDRRALCVSCMESRCKDGFTYCRTCAHGLNICGKFADSSECKYGTKCYRRHGICDRRPMCTKCHKCYIGSECNYCVRKKMYVGK